MLYAVLSTAVIVHGKSIDVFAVDPGTSESVPSVSVAAADGESWTSFFYEVDKGKKQFLTSSMSTATSVPLVFVFPKVQADTFMEMALTTSTTPKTNDFRWRTITRPDEKKLMRYTGQKNLLPPDDFEEYWQRATNQLDAVPANPRVTRVPDKDTSTGLLFRVELDSVENTTIVGWFFVPRDAYKDGNPDGEIVKRYPAILLTPGYGGEEPPTDRTKAGYITFSTNPRNHGPSKSYWKSPVEHQLYNIDKPEDYFYKLAALDCLQAARFVLGRKEVMEASVGAEGGSQGGYLAIATAMLEPRIRCVAANVVAFTDYPDGMALSLKGGHTRVRELLKTKGTTATLVAKSLAYTDGANLITKMKAPVQIFMGGVDPVIPYVCGIVAYNRIPKGVKKEFLIDPSAAHEITDDMRAGNRNWMDRWLKTSEGPNSGK